MNFFNDSIKPLCILLFRYTRKKAGRGLRWSMRSPLRMLLTLAVIFMLALGIHGLTKDDAPRDAQETGSQSLTQDDGLTYRDVEARPLDQDGHPSPATGTTTPSSKSESATEKPKKDVAAPTKPTADRKKKESTTTAFMRALLSREEGNDQWKSWTSELTNEQLASYLADAKAPVDGRGSTAVKNVQIGKKPFSGAPKDTKIRWSRPVTATVGTEIGPDIKVTYEITAMQGEKGWEITDAVERGWTKAG